MDKPKVYLAMPQYGGTAHVGAMYSAISWPTEGGVDVVDFSDSGSSLLPHSFNGLLARALDLRDEGKVTHFAMLHSDIHTQAGWIDRLYQEARNYKAAVISAVVPIKDREPGRTSTAIGSREYPWVPKAYIELRHRADLPPTFGAKEVCTDSDDVFLINTGCLLADLRMPFWESFAFDFRSRITKKDGKRFAQIQPEDWLLSRALDEAGIRYAATWAVSLVHYGAGEWDNGWRQKGA